MERVKTTPRPGWEKIVESQGFHYHHTDDEEGSRPFWDESVYYHFEADEIDKLEEATYWINQYCLQAVDHIINNNLFDKVGVPASHVEWVKRSWERDEHTIYGRLDFSYRERDMPKLLEYNADTPTTLLESAVIQWYWLKDCHEFADQYNSIHDALLEIFKELRNHHDGKFFFAALADNLEDFMTVNYLRDVAIQAGWTTEYLNVEDIGWHEMRKQFTDMNENTIRNCFKLYPWEWMVREQFGEKLLQDTTNWFEPPWKTILSNKGLMVVLWEMFPESPYLLPASFEPLNVPQIRKPLHGREGANAAFLMPNGVDVIMQNDGPYNGPFIYQATHELPCFDGTPGKDGYYPMIGSWLVNGYACGIGIREDKTPITSNHSRFVPHIFTGK